MASLDPARTLSSSLQASRAHTVHVPRRAVHARKTLRSAQGSESPGFPLNRNYCSPLR